MALYTRFGDKIELVRVATLGDVKTFERRKVDRADRERTKEGWRAVARYVDIESGVGRDKKEILVDAGYLKADDGSKEITAAFDALHYPASAQA